MSYPSFCVSSPRFGVATTTETAGGLLGEFLPSSGAGLPDPQPHPLNNRASSGLSWRSGSNCRERLTYITERARRSSMQAPSETLFPMPEARPVSFLGDWRGRASRLTEIANRRGGLIPQSVLHKVLGVHRSRAHQLCQEGILEVVNFCGTLFVTGDSIEQYRNAPPQSGRGHKLTRWDRVVIPIETGLAIADAITE
jgi:hypothetical protein